MRAPASRQWRRQWWRSPDEDLLDLADIFAESDPTPLREMTEVEMRRRNISL